MISVHGLIRSANPELGRDADTGGQVGYVLELARATSLLRTFSKVELLTRKISDPKVSEEYANEFEQIVDSDARIVRLACGPKRYLRKELLWSHLDEYVDNCLAYFRSEDRIPDVIHTHYADSGYIGLQLSSMLGVPQIHTGHSLGRVKQGYLTESGMSPRQVEKRYRISKRIEVEEQLLDGANATITSTRQEIEEQYGLYNIRRRSRMVTIPPGLDLSRFHPPTKEWKPGQEIREEIDHFLRHPNKPMILTIARADPRKNLDGLIEAYASSPELQRLANLVIVAGNRDDLKELESSQAKALHDLILLIDRFDLYGLVALPKHHQSDDVPDLFRLAVKRKGVFINPATTEGFGLTLIEAAASGLPIIATSDGGPKEIVKYLHNGLLIDPSDPQEITSSLTAALSSPTRWRAWSKNGIGGVQRHYTWDAHVSKYAKLLNQVIRSSRKMTRQRIEMFSGPTLITRTKMIVLDIDDTLIGDSEGLAQFLEWLRANRSEVAFAVATGRTANSAKQVLLSHGIDRPDVYISAVGSEISYGSRLIRDDGWTNHVRRRWRRSETEAAMAEVPGLMLQTHFNQREFKISYIVDTRSFPGTEHVSEVLQSRRLSARLVYSRNKFLDVIPINASKGHALRYLTYRWGIPLDRVLAAGDSGNDEQMLLGVTLGVVVANHSPELDLLKGTNKIYFAKESHAKGILEGIRHYHFDTL